MKKFLKVLSVIFVIAEFCANTPSQAGTFQLDIPSKLKKQNGKNII